MAFTLGLPDEINFGSQAPTCSGITGNSGSLSCDISRRKKTLFFDNVFTFYDANPGTIDINIDKLLNPSTNLVTQSFYIVTQTFDGYFMDSLAEGMSINFYCEYPCAECPQGSPSKCELCY